MNKLIQINDFPAVVAAADVKNLRLSQNSLACSHFVKSYLGFDEHACFTLQTLINSLSKSGGSYFINGVFGSGKSHLLGILTLLGDGLGHADFLQIHPQFAAQISAFPKRFTVYFSLDEYDGSHLSLEEITWREMGLHAHELGFEIDVFDATTSVSRSEQMLILEEKLQQQGFCGLQLCVDELSLFLGAKDHRSLQSEASWLQFLGQRAARESTFSLWCCFALQKEWQDVGDLEPYSVSQVRDRFQTLTLSMAHLPSLVKHRLVQQKDADAIHQLCNKSYHELSRAWPQIDFGIAEWEDLFPFHPATIELLEQVSSRFFSRTRSAVLFCSHALKRYIREDAANTERITPPQIFDYFKPEFSQYAELKELDRIWRVWEETIPRLARDNTESTFYTILLKTLLLFRLSGHDITCIQLANTLHRDLNLGAEENYQYIHQLLLRWSKNGDHLSLERGDNWQQDRFSVTLGQSIQQTVRRHTQRVLETLQPGDARIVSRLFETCDDTSFPLKSLLNGAKQIQVDWQNSPRQTEVALWQQNSSTQLLHQLLNWRQHNNMDVYLFLKVPFVDVKFPDLSNVPERNKAALLLWQPRQPTTDEWEFARETTARFILHHDPALRDNRRGRAVIKFLERDLKERSRDIQHLMIRLYCEGRLTSGDKRYIEISELCHQRNWDALISSISSFGLEILYPTFHEISPTVKVLSSSHVNQLGNKLLQQNGKDIWWPASLDRPVRAIAVPLGLAADDKGRWKYAAKNDNLIAEIENLLAENGLPITALESHLSASIWGLLPQQIELILCGMVGAGRLEMLDAHGKVLLPAQVKMPLAQSNYFVRRAALMDSETWNRVCNIIETLSEPESLSLSFASQMRAAQILRDWRETAIAELELTNARLRQLQKVLDNAPALWKNTTRTIDDIKILLHALNRDESSALLESAAALNAESTKAILHSWQELQQGLDANQTSILQLLGRLSHPQITPPENLILKRESLLHQFLEGEKVLSNTQLLRDANSWNEEFLQQYHNWHQQQFTGERWQELRHFAHQPALQAFTKIANVKRYPFPDHSQLNTKLQTALRRQCPRDGNLLASEICCNHCQLRFGQIVELPDLAEFSARIEVAARQIFDLFQSDDIKRHLQRSDAGRELLNWNGESKSLLMILNESALLILENALLPRRKFQRSMQSLQRKFGEGGTRAELESTFKEWLEAGDAMGADDEITISN